jgi:hypothetical protein
MTGDGSGLVDAITIADPASVSSHKFKSSDQVTRSNAGDFVGGHDMHRKSHVVRGGAGAWVSYQLKIAPQKATTIEIEEIDGRESDVVRAYHVLVDDQPVHLRTWRTCGAGPLHYFVQIPPANRDRVTLKLVSKLPSTFAVSRIWSFSDFDHYFEAANMAVPYYIAPAVQLKWDDFEADVEQVRQIRDSLGQPRDIKPAWTTWIAYAAWSDAMIAQRIDYALRISRQLQMPVQICLDSWWANTPAGADGQGGFWSDVKYQQVVFNVTRNRLELSIPNRWSSTPWLCMNEPLLNAFKVRRLSAAAVILRERYRKLVSQGNGDLILAINLDNEPIYWASGNAGLGRDLLEADFNASTVANAKRDGVDLDPSDGLTRKERLWLWRNLQGYNAMIAGTVADALGDISNVSASGEAVVSQDAPANAPIFKLRNRTFDVEAEQSANVAASAPPHVVDLLRNNVYTQAMMMSAPEHQFPMNDASYPLWESAAPASCRVGGEWNSDAADQLEGMLHQIPLGRCAAVNAECEGHAENMLGVLPGYALGQRFYTPYNYPLNHMDIAVSRVSDLSRPFTTLLYEPALTDVNFAGAAWKSQAIAQGGLDLNLVGNTAIFATTPASSTSPGYATFHIAAPFGRTFDRLAVELEGRAKNFSKPDPSVCMRVLAGRNAELAEMTEVGRVSDSGDLNVTHRIDLSEAARGTNAVFVRIELAAPGVEHSMLSWCALSRARFTIPWSQQDIGAPASTSVETARKQNLLVSWRRDAELMLDELARENLDPKTARAEYDRGQYAKAYSIACQTIAQRSRKTPPPPLPATPADPDTPRTLAGTFVASNSASSFSMYPDDTGVAERVTITPQTRFARDTFGASSSATAATLADFRRGDQITSVVDENGAAIQVRGSFLELVGSISQYTPISPQHMPSITLAGDARPHVIDLSAPLHLPDGEVTIRSVPADRVKFAPGDQVALRVNPKTGRVFELWRVAK